MGGPLRSIYTLTIWGGGGGSLRSVYSLTIWGPPRSVSLLTIWGRLAFFWIFYALNYPWGGPHIFEFPGGGMCPLLPPPPLRAPMHEGAKKAAAQIFYNKNSMNLSQISKGCNAINTFT